MFNQFFSKKSADNFSHADKERMITEAFRVYKSENFPEGILALCDKIGFSHAKQQCIVHVTLPFPCLGELDILAQSLTESLAVTVNIDFTLDVQAVRRHQVKNVANIIAISSGKGGVGKSTSTVNIAYSLIAEGAKVGILDADIYGPSIPTMLGLKNGKPSTEDGKSLLPLKSNGLYAMSIGFLVPDEEATVWRGPMASSAFSQLLNETAWPELDYLLIDMPPGTGDLQLTLAQKVPVAAAVIITTPQDIALADAIKGIAMFDKVQIPVLGVVENMSYHRCESCGHQAHLFGKGGGEDIAKKYDTRLLGQLPLDINIREGADAGKSAIIQNSTSEITQVYRKIARNIAAQLFCQLDVRSANTVDVCLQTDGNE